MFPISTLELFLAILAKAKKYKYSYPACYVKDLQIFSAR